MFKSTFNSLNIPVHPNRERLLEIASNSPKHEPAIYQPIVYEPFHENINMFYVEILAENYVEALVKFFDLMNEHMKYSIDFFDFNLYNLPLDDDPKTLQDLTGWELWKINEPFEGRLYGGMTVGKYALESHSDCDPEDCTLCQQLTNVPKHFKISDA